MHRLKHHVLSSCLVAAVCAAPLATAHAGLTLATSLGYGYQVSPTSQTDATSLMVAPGFGLGSLLRLELGILGAWDAARAGNTAGLGLQFRPMLVVSPPVLPIYGRLVLAMVDPFASTRTVAYGAAGGVSVSLGGLGLFAEAGVLPRSYNAVISWVVEGRAGLNIDL